MAQEEMEKYVRQAMRFGLKFLGWERIIIVRGGRYG